MSMTQEVSCLYSHESVESLLVLQQLFLPAPSVDLLEPSELLCSSLLPLLCAHAATWQLTGEGKLHAVNLTLIKLWTAPLFHLYKRRKITKLVHILFSTFINHQQAR